MAGPNSPKVLKGALVVLDSAGMVGVVPRVLPFQYNPETLSRDFELMSSEEEEGDLTTVQPEAPLESFSLSLIFDGTDSMEVPEENQPDVSLDEDVPASGNVAVQLAALEQLLYPSGSSVMDSGLVEIPDAMDLLGDALGINIPLPRPTAPVVLFVWGPHYILPVRLTSYSVEEQRFTPKLYPIRAEVDVDLEVVKPAAFGAQPTPVEKIAIAAYVYTMGQREALALGAYGTQFKWVLDKLSF